MRRLFAAGTFENETSSCNRVQLGRLRLGCVSSLYRFARKKELLRCEIATVSPRRSSAKNRVLQELHVVMNRICISTYVNLHF